MANPLGGAPGADRERLFSGFGMPWIWGFQPVCSSFVHGQAQAALTILQAVSPELVR
ncbi:hypothetical protein [Azospirillum argentinense]